ncbi:MAG: deoxyribonuclease IV [Candidatus Bathyarchaeia archaeon]
MTPSLRVMLVVKAELMLRVGFHVSIAGTIDEAVDRAVELGCNTFQMFTRTPRAWAAGELSSDEVRAFVDKVNSYDVKPVFAHVPYLLNLASARQDVYARSVKALKEELARCRRLEVPFLVTHLGSHLGAGKQKGFERIVRAVDEAYRFGGAGVVLLLENTAGTRNSMGGRFEDISRIVSSVAKPEFVGVCFDTAHGFASGYDLRSVKAVEETLRVFDEVIGFDRLKLVHLNDSWGGWNSRVDRHQHIGLGKIGEKGFRAILHSRLRELPLILETPWEGTLRDVDNLRKVKELAGEI